MSELEAGAPAVLDASALLALLNVERGAEVVAAHLAAAVIPVGHGMAAVATFAFAVVTAAGTR